MKPLIKSKVTQNVVTLEIPPKDTEEDTGGDTQGGVADGAGNSADNAARNERDDVADSRTESIPSNEGKTLPQDE